MYKALRAAQDCEMTFLDGGGCEGRRSKDEVVGEAVEALMKLEGLLLKEGLLGVPLANTYRSLAKWSERSAATSGGEVAKWKAKELAICSNGFGPDAQRTRDIEAILRELRGFKGGQA